MKYELIIGKTQPSCGGKPPKVFEYQDVETEDPAAYVRERFPEAELEIRRISEETVQISFTNGAQQCTYEFTEE